MSFADKLPEHRAAKVVAKLLGANEHYEMLDNLEEYALVLQDNPSVATPAYQFDEVIQHIAEVMSSPDVRNFDQLRTLPEFALVAVLDKFPGKQLLKVGVDAYLSNDELPAAAISVKKIADTLSELIPVKMPDRGEMTNSEFRQRINNQQGLDTGIVDDVIVTVGDTRKLSEHMMQQYPELFVSHLLDAVTTVECSPVMSKEFQTAVWEFPWLDTLTSLHREGLKGPVGLKGASRGTVIYVAKAYSDLRDTLEESDKAVREVLELTRELNDGELEGEEKDTLVLRSEEDVKLAHSLGLSARMAPTTSTRVADQVPVVGNDFADRVKRMVEAAKNPGESYCDDDMGAYAPSPFARMSANEVAAALGALKKEVTPSEMADYLDEVYTLFSEENGVMKAVGEDFPYWFEVAECSCVMMYPTQNGGRMMNLGDLWYSGEIILRAALKLPGGARKMLDWLDETDKSGDMVTDAFLYQLGQSVVYGVDDCVAQELRSDAELVTDVADRVLRVEKLGSVFQGGHRAFLVNDYVVSKVPAGMLKEVINLPATKKARTGEAHVYRDVRDKLVMGDVWFSDDAVDREEKIRTVLRHISQRGVGEENDWTIPPGRVRAVLDHYGWEESPKLISFLKGLPAETTFDEAAELFKKA